DSDFDAALQHAKQLGVQWVKLQFAWNLLEPAPGEFGDAVYRFRLFVQRADREGFKVMVSLAKAPGWARSSQEEDGPSADPQALASLISRLLGEIRVDLWGFSYIDAIEVWNEPNLRREWNGNPLTGADYMRYFDAAYNAIRTAEGGANIVVVTAGLAPTGINDGVNATDDRVYLRQMYQAGLSNPGYQNIAIGVHPYSAWNPPDARCCTNSGQGYDDHPTFFFMDNLEDYHNIMLEFGDTTRQMWATEFGWATYDGLYRSDGQPAVAPDSVPYFNYINQEQQANYIVRAFEIGRDTPYIGVMVLWNLNFASDYYVDNQDPRAGYSLLGTGPNPLRFAYTVLQHVPALEPPGD
ncbi:MAG: cellulase family glycosylhydrolase, partial [Anaerolineae bacterium]|nr:cellulase family glycosylhydrolase [Anaerolineae bacterium]